MRKTPPSTISVSYADPHSRMSPSTLNTANIFDNQYTSLFGDPVPPPPDNFFEDLDKNLYSSVRRRSSSIQSNSIVDDFPKANSFVPHGAIGHSQRITSSRLSRQDSDDQLPGRTYAIDQRISNICSPIDDIRYSTASTVPGNQFFSQSSSITNRPQLLISPPSQDFDDDVPWSSRRRSSTISDNFRSNLANLRDSLMSESRHKRIFPNEPIRARREESNESFSSNDWFNPTGDYPEWSKIPRLRPSSKNVMSINQENRSHQGSPLASLIQGSNMSTSSDEKPSPRLSKSSIFGEETPLVLIAGDLNDIEDESIPPTELPPPDAATIQRDIPLPIVTNAVNTGSTFRVNLPRPKKKSSFTIIAERSPQSSRPTSPSPGNSGRVSPFLGYGFKESSRPTSRRQSLSSNIQLPNITDNNNNQNTSDDSARPLVQFNMSSFPSPALNQPPAKSILQQKSPKPTQPKRKDPSKLKPLAKVHSFESLPKLPKNLAPSSRLPPRRLNKTSLEMKQKPLWHVGLPLPRSNQNPTSRQKGLLQVVSTSANNSPSRIPIKQNGASSMENVSTMRRQSLSPLRRDVRKDSTSSERRSSSLTVPRSSITSDRRSSNLSTMTTSDFSFRRNSISPTRNTMDPSNLNIRSVRSSPRSPRRVAKPTSLSPIIGTPNKDSQPSDENPVETVSSSRRSSQTKIPLSGGSRTPSRSNSRVPSRSNSRAPSAINSRSASPSKEFLPFSRPNSRATSRPTSRASSRADSRIPSRMPSRSSSRASMQERPPKASSLSPPKDRKGSPFRKSRSESPKKLTRKSASPTKVASPHRRGSIRLSGRRSSSTGKIMSPKKSPSPEKVRKSRIPSKKEPISAKKPTSTLKKPEPSVRRVPSTSRKDGNVKPGANVKKTLTGAKRDMSTLKPTSTIRREGSNLKREPLNLRGQGSNLRRETSNLRQEGSNLKKDPSNVKRERSNLRRETSNLQKPGMKREGSSLKREGSNLRRERSNVKREGSNIKREGSNLKREGSNLKRDGSNLRREGSNLKRTPSNLKREQSNLSRETTSMKREPSNLKKDGSRTSLKKTMSNPKIETGSKAGLTKNRSDSSLTKKLEKKSSFRIEKTAKAAANESDTSTVPGESLKEDPSDPKGEKLVPLTKANVVSMTTAAITAQPVQITTSITNQMPLTKTNSSNQLLGSDSAIPRPDMQDMDPMSILEKSQKTLETVQKTVTDATEEIQKTINENLTDLRTLESDMGTVTPLEKSDLIENHAFQNDASSTTPKPSASLEPTGGDSSKPSKSPLPPTQPIEANVSVLTSTKSSDNLLHPKTNHNNNNRSSSSSSGGAANGTMTTTVTNSEDMAERVSERAISVLPEVECESANLQNYVLSSDVRNNNNDTGGHSMTAKSEMSGTAANQNADGNDGGKTDAGTMTTTAADDKMRGADSQEYLDDDKPKGCCSRFCSKLCMPCRRCMCCACCRRQKGGSARSDERTIVEEVNEKKGCWQRCCSCCRKKKHPEPKMLQQRMESIREERESQTSSSMKQQNKCCLCLGKVFCCRKTNKVEATADDGEEVRKCCFCIPCGRKKKQSNAWQDRRESIISDPPPQPGCCTRLCNKILCCRKPKPVSESRRTSMNSKKQSLAPTIPPEDSRPKLHNDLVEYNSKMKGAVPVMPLWIAWFCMICNCVIPGLGTILSGFFCLCVGIPRFSQYDSGAARIGSLIINCIVGVAQAFCVLFCFVGWGWSIWWGTIMLKTARKLKKIRRVEELEMQEEQRQQAAEKARMERDVEAQKKEEKK